MNLADKALTNHVIDDHSPHIGRLFAYSNDHNTCWIKKSFHRYLPFIFPGGINALSDIL
jgi:hypothetical protein